ncbi:MAG: PHP domain-containing protein [Alphaproteobacteria bacterium]|nr:PHP domain-containing protein [Alphaproteobacteria bacterium]
MGISPYIHLRVFSAYSLSEGALKMEDITSLCKQYHMPAVAICDRANLFGSLEFSKACTSKGIQPIIGCIVSLPHPNKEGQYWELPLYAQNENGYQNLLKLVSDSYTAITPGLAPHITWENLNAHHLGLIAFTGGSESLVGQFLLNNQETDAIQWLQSLHTLFGDRLYIELSRHGREEETILESYLIDCAYAQHIPWLPPIMLTLPIVPCIQRMKHSCVFHQALT